MKLVTLIFRLGFAILLLLSLPARADDTLWNKTLAQAKASKQFVPGDIDIAVTFGRDPLTPKRFRSHLTGWENGNPVYSTTEVNPLPGASQDRGKSIVTMINAIVEITGELPDPQLKALRLEGQVIDGKSWTEFQQSETGIGKKLVAKIWVHPETGCLHQVDANTHAALQADARIHISYMADATGRCLPQQIDADIDLLIPFKKTKMKLTQTSSNWVERPQTPKSR
ncbi:MAG: hypothetical protein V4631_12185 [Pseudomonadota bacterium]